VKEFLELLKITNVLVVNFKTPKYEGVICDRCGVQVTESKVRRERIGHIVLAAPVAHIWYYKSSPSKIAILLNIKLKDLHSVLFHEKIYSYRSR